MRNSKGFTLIEIIVAVALVAILSAAVAPSVLNNIAQGRVSRTQSDVQAIASAVARFKTDVGVFPYLGNGSEPDTKTVKLPFLASADGDHPLESGAAANWPAGASPTAFTTGAVSGGSVEMLGNHLINGWSGSEDTSTLATLYPTAANPADPTEIGFRFGLLSSDPADPWGHKYIINTGALGTTGEPVWVISAGPNGALETPIGFDTGLGASDTLGGDDIGFRIQ